ncbi:MAG: pseudouridine synthase [Hyphomicrobiales bacterium]
MNKKPDTKPHDDTQDPSSEEPQIQMRIAKAIARAGVCSRREAETYIAAGRIKVNGKKITSPALNVTSSDKILVDGQPLPDQEPVKIWRYHKPKGLVTTAKDEKDRETIFSKLPKHLPRTITIGRLDINTEGLLLLTNDGELARHLELPKTGWLRRYKVRAKGNITQDKLNALKEGITIEGIKYGPIQAQLIKEQGSNCWFTMGLREGKNREIKRICEHLGLNVNRLIRLSFGPFMLGDLKAGEVEDIKPHILADQLGPELSEKFSIKPSTNQAQSKKDAQKKSGSKSGKKLGSKSKFNKAGPTNKKENRNENKSGKKNDPGNRSGKPSPRKPQRRISKKTRP